MVYDKGSASPLEIARGLDGLGTFQFVAPDSPHVREMMPLLRRWGDVTALDDALRWTVDSLDRHPDAVLTFSEMMVTHAARLSFAFGLPGHSTECGRALTDKREQRRLLRDAGVDVIRFHVIADPSELGAAVIDVGLPVIVKPVRGEGSRNTVAIERPDQVDEVEAEKDLWSPGESLIVEELLQGRVSDRIGDYVSVESLVYDGVARHLPITGKFPLVTPFRETGQFWPALLEPGEAGRIEELTSAALRSLGVRWGICHTEIKLTQSGPRIIEVNGRLGGHIAEMAHRSAGLDLIRCAALLALGVEPDVGPISLEQVYFQYHNPAPLYRCVLEGVHGAREVMGTPGVDSYQQRVRTGTLLGTGVGTVLLDASYGRAGNHEEMTGLVDRIAGQLRFSFGVTGDCGGLEQRVVTGRELVT
ncbi:ATP-grasp domain-containing protein [Longispora sp. NPDC051575]|uniref:ATP-grasp domain-containing protein n=1 Tax=Longispora sp. NPDC051575 TaxID=3154943 RepID=UPI003431FD6F